MTEDHGDAATTTPPPRTTPPQDQTPTTGTPEAGAPASPAIGSYRPPRIGALEAAGIPSGLARELHGLSGVASSVSDALDVIGIRTAVPGSACPPLRPDWKVIGRVVTLRYLPARTAIDTAAESRMAHRTLFELASPGDVAVIVGPPALPVSLLGGEAGAMARSAGLAGCIVAGAIRDVDELLDGRLPVFATSVTPITGRWRIEAVEINGPVDLAGVQVLPGDVAVADASGIAFIPADRVQEVLARVVGR
jgi:regulator of RNase E activity RraA